MSIGRQPSSIRVHAGDASVFEGLGVGYRVLEFARLKTISAAYRIWKLFLEGGEISRDVSAYRYIILSTAMYAISVK